MTKTARFVTLLCVKLFLTVVTIVQVILNLFDRAMIQQQLLDAIGHHLFDVPVAQGKCVVEPDTVADDFIYLSLASFCNTTVYKISIPENGQTT